MVNLDLSELSVPQLKQIKAVVTKGALAIANDANSTNGNCLCDIASRVKSYIKEHYDVYLKDSEAEEFVNDWKDTFIKYNDSNKSDNGALESSVNNEDVNMEDKLKIAELEKQLADATKSLETKTSELETAVSDVGTKTSELDTLFSDIKGLRDQNEELVKYWFDREVEAERTKLLSDRKAKMVEAGLTSVDIEAESEYWLGLNESQFDITIKKMGETKKEASASINTGIPAVIGAPIEGDAVSKVREELRKLKNRD